ncbi:hypothetical protein P4S93_04065 [Aneurinibacillus thermoaerophilus]|uniref:Uncharacterized protein n=2 Tax=Aneurinibacillus thermoaerophilus TaxID=143495 RepID=A0A1G7WWS7_ANETH|nr:MULTISPECIES: hypothetical protein [Aneurinibacillus]AMA73912.1 hypothetical protein ACH33_14405 [Aneurinibacillus sp. XH2]MED0674097.1 hypothetical protein [Aneurinibacillus thermoaerophilus]MED0678083.1 hypothetical protein [Aneurinibacillus thermoaerophilus]MED0755714.1 hypothetical protein [Aneurinibacillus thermoaerophilus]MED0759957.1 hypothetical protein [Aneurinibacillus thermoaerophilus]
MCGRMVYRTRRTITTEARVEAESGTLLAMATGSFRVLKSSSDTSDRRKIKRKERGDLMHDYEPPRFLFIPFKYPNKIY